MTEGMRPRPMTLTRKLYIGDGVYADFDGYSIVLTTENGISVTNRIVLEPEVLTALLDYVQRLKEALEASRMSADPSVTKTS